MRDRDRGVVTRRAVLRAWVGPPALGAVLYGAISLPLGVLDLGCVCLVLPVTAVPAVRSRLRPPGSACPGAPLTDGLSALATGHRWLAARLLGAWVTAPPAPARPLTIRPARPPDTRPPGPPAWARLARAADPAAPWRTVLYLLLKLPLAVVMFWVWAPCWAWAAVLISFPAWWRALPPWLDSDLWRQPHRGPLRLGALPLDVWPNCLLVTAAGVLLLLAAPWVNRVVLVDGLLVRALLGRSEKDRLRESRALAVDGSTAALRRIERDLHDGAQAQLVALAMKLGMAREELTAGARDEALTLIEAAHGDAKQALVELRDLARGIHPAALDDGLALALETLAARSAIPVELRVDLPERPAPAIETIAYFGAAELLANAAKHSGARRVTLTVRPVGPNRLCLAAADDGTGGARTDGGGLAGLIDRVRTVEGRVFVDSPAGGPTVVRVELPVRP